MIHNIDAKTAAHNTATLFSAKFINSQESTRILDIDGTEICTSAKRAAEIYAIVYDEIYDYFTKANQDGT